MSINGINNTAVYNETAERKNIITGSFVFGTETATKINKKNAVAIFAILRIFEHHLLEPMTSCAPGQHNSEELVKKKTCLHMKT